ncbi:MAG: glucose-6-phosphate dehydrogenase [Planctomycetes bacterium]|nr:glucose-6-phosphate dehydrogenase [Planctomycetota bacterium]
MLSMADSADPCVIVIFGASGDLVSRKLIPSLYEMSMRGDLPEQTCILGISRTELSDDAWREKLKTWVEKHANGFDDDAWAKFAKRIYYHPGSATENDIYPALSKRIEDLSQQSNCRGNILFYLSVGPTLYEPIVECIGQSGLVLEGRKWCSIDREKTPWQRIIVEKPFGHDLASASSLNLALGRVFEEDAIYRIDHYLGKELVQSLLAFRFANTIFEPLWNHRYIDHVQITAVETLGVGHRAGFYDSVGALRDMIQSHLLQVLSLVAMEPPTSFDAHHIRQEKIKVIDAIESTPIDRLSEFAALGQYAGDKDEPAYHLAEGVPENSKTETFAAISLFFDNWRWAKTPFYIRTGKRLAAKCTQVVVQFKQPPVELFKQFDGENKGNKRSANQIIIEIAPRGGVSLRFAGKVPGTGMKVDTVEMDFDYAERFKADPIEAYGPLLIDAMRGDQTLFQHRYEVEGSWRAVEPFLGEQSAAIRKDIQENYKPGSWGPDAADMLLKKNDREWLNTV